MHRLLQLSFIEEQNNHRLYLMLNKIRIKERTNNEF